MAFHHLNNTAHTFISIICFHILFFVLIFLTEHKFDFGFYLYQSKVFIRIADKPILTKRFFIFVANFLKPQPPIA